MSLKVVVLYAGMQSQIMNMPIFALGLHHVATTLTIFCTCALIVTAVMGTMQSF
jgi:hypothetical protein